MGPAISSMSAQSIAVVEAVEADLRRSNRQVGLKTQHVLHGGLYCRTILVPEGHEAVGALIKVPTMIIMSGDVFAWIEDGWQHLTGYTVIPASAVRKQRVFANADTYISMFFPSRAKTVDEAEREFTDDFKNLLTRRIDAGEETIITGE